VLKEWDEKGYIYEVLEEWDEKGYTYEVLEEWDEKGYSYKKGYTFRIYVCLPLTRKSLTT